MSSTFLAVAQQQAHDWSQYFSLKDFFFAFVGAVMGTLIGVAVAQRQEATRIAQRRLAVLQPSRCHLPLHSGFSFSTSTPSSAIFMPTMPQNIFVRAQTPGALSPEFQEALASCIDHCTITEAEISKLVGRLERLAQ
jgi:hypothetical protein